MCAYAQVLHAAAGGPGWHPSRAMTLPEMRSNSPSVPICGSAGAGVGQRSQTEATLLLASPGNRSPSCGGGGVGLSASNWSLQRKMSLEQQLRGHGAADAGGPFGTSPSASFDAGPVVFVAPELTQETLLEVRIEFSLIVAPHPRLVIDTTFTVQEMLPRD